GTGTQNAISRTETSRLRVIRRHVQTLIIVWNEKRILAGVIRHRPVPFCIVRTDNMPLVIFFEYGVPVDGSLTGGRIDVGNVELRRIVREGTRPKKLPVAAINHPYSPGFSNSRNDVPFLAARNLRIGPFDFLRIGIERCAEQNALMGVVLIPIVAWEILI